MRETFILSMHCCFCKESDKQIEISTVGTSLKTKGKELRQVAENAGWLSVVVGGNPVGHICPSCTAQNFPTESSYDIEADVPDTVEVIID